jgi:protein-disulfide isomerase
MAWLRRRSNAPGTASSNRVPGVRACGAACLIAIVALSTARGLAQSSDDSTGSPADVVAIVGSTPITLRAVDDRALAASTASVGDLPLFQALYEARRLVLESMIDDLLIDHASASRGVSRTTLFEAEVIRKVSRPSPADVTTWYTGNASRLQGATLETARAGIEALLLQQRIAEARMRYLQTLRASIAVTRRLSPPRRRIAAAGHPTRGSSAAPVEIIEFSDFECPFCGRAELQIRQVEERYGDRVRVVYRHFPLSMHPHAAGAAEASMCAAEQNQFWPYHDALFAEQGKLSVEDLKRTARTLKLDGPSFDACVDSHRFRDAVGADVRDGTANGVVGTPTFFINGRFISGQQTLDALAHVIDEELSQR